MTALHIFGLVCLALAPILATAAYYLHQDSLRHRRATGRYVRCVSCGRFRPVEQSREIKRPMVMPGRPLAWERVWICDACESNKEAA